MAKLAVGEGSDDSVAVAEISAMRGSVPGAAIQGRTLDDFTSFHDLANFISSGADLAARCFDLDQPVRAELMSDQETGEAWVEPIILVRGSIPEVRLARRSFTRECLRIVPAEKTLLIRPGLSLV